MKYYAAFFRGINVGGKNKVKMDELKDLFSNCGFDNVKTYIQSGNVIFTSDKNKSDLSKTISTAFSGRFGFDSNVVLRSADEIASIVSGIPFTKAEIERAETTSPDVEHIYIYLSDNDIDKTALEKLCSDYNGNDKLVSGKQELYLLCYQSIRDSKLASLLAKLGVQLTARNQKTMRKICELLEQQ